MMESLMGLLTAIRHAFRVALGQIGKILTAAMLLLGTTLSVSNAYGINTEQEEQQQIQRYLAS